jgi:hypothetical protein
MDPGGYRSSRNIGAARSARLVYDDRFVGRYAGLHLLLVTLKTNKKESVHAGAEGPVRSIMLLSGGVVLPTANEQRRQAK